MCKVAQSASSTDDAMTSSGEGKLHPPLPHVDPQDDKHSRTALGDHHRPQLATAYLSPSQGSSGTEVTVWAAFGSFRPQQSAHHSTVRIAFEATLLRTQIMTPTDARGWVSLVSIAPPHHQLQTASAEVPVYVCLIQDSTVLQNWFVGKFTYTDPPVDARPKLLTQPWPGPTHNPEYRSRSESGPCSAIDEHHNKIHVASNTTEAPMALNVVRQNLPRQSSKKPRPQMSVTLQDYTPYPKIDHPAELQFMGDFHGLAWDWTQEEIDASRRLVRFWRVQHDSPFKIRCAFKAVSAQEYHSSQNVGVVVSCIAYRDNLYVTSVDIINFLESILRYQFSIDEKNRVRRNLEGFHPITASKYHESSIDLFRHIMGFAEPKPRNIEKDIKIFSWDILPYAAKKIIVKHFATQQERSSEYMLPVFPHLPPLVSTYSTDHYEHFAAAGPLTPQDDHPVYRKD